MPHTLLFFQEHVLFKKLRAFAVFEPYLFQTEIFVQGVTPLLFVLLFHTYHIWGNLIAGQFRNSFHESLFVVKVAVFVCRNPIPFSFPPYPKAPWRQLRAVSLKTGSVGRTLQTFSSLFLVCFSVAAAQSPSSSLHLQSSPCPYRLL